MKMDLNLGIMTKKKDNRKYKDRGVAHPTIPKAGFTKTRRRLEDGGKLTT